MSHFSCVVIGNESLLIGCADALLQRGHDIRAVVSTDPAICTWAADKGLPQLDKTADLNCEFDWLFSVANLSLIPDAVLSRAAKGAINFHDGPLPRYAGLNTPNWALINGEPTHGITWHMIEGGVDEGDIIAQRLFDITDGETAFSLNSKCYAAAMDSFAEVITEVETGTPKRQSQDLSQRSYFARADRPAAGGRLDFTRTTDEVCRLVRGLDFGGYWNPLCAAKLDINGQTVLVGSATEAAPGPDGASGTVLGLTNDTVTIVTSDGAVTLGGLSLPDGSIIRLSDLCQPGDVLATLTTEQVDALTKQMAATQAGESHWRSALKAMQPVLLPLAQDQIETGYSTTVATLAQFWILKTTVFFPADVFLDDS